MRRGIGNSTTNVTSSTSCHMEEEAGEVTRRGPWTLEEDTLLTHYVARRGEGRWNLLAKCAGLKRNGKSCRLRWLNYLKPDIKRGNLTPQEQLLILELHSKWGNRWSKIAQHLPGRTDNEIKNYWRTRVQKQARQLNIESDSQSFLEAVRSFWMPRLVQKMEQAASSCSASSVTNFQSPVPSNSEIHGGYSVIPPSPISTDLTQTLTSTSDQTSMRFFPDQLQLFNDPALTPNQCGDHGSNVLVDSSYYYNMGNINPVSDMTDRASMSVMSTMDHYYGSSSSSISCQMANAEWTYAEANNALWNMDDIWQFEK